MTTILTPIITQEEYPILARVRPKKSLYTLRDRHFQGVTTKKELVTKYLTPEEAKDLNLNFKAGETLKVDTEEDVHYMISWIERRLDTRGMWERQQRKKILVPRHYARHRNMRYELAEAAKAPLCYLGKIRTHVEEYIEYWRDHDVDTPLLPCAICFLTLVEHGNDLSVTFNYAFKVKSFNTNSIVIATWDDKEYIIEGLDFLKHCMIRDFIIFAPSNITLDEKV